MEIEFNNDRRRGRIVIAIGVILALAAGAAAYVVLQQAQQTASSGPGQRMGAVVAVAAIPARAPIQAKDVTIQEVALNPANAQGVATDITQVVGHVTAVTILQGQLVTTNMLAATAQTGEYSILAPDETISPDSTPWRAVSLTVPDDLAVAGTLKAGQTVDVFVTAVVDVPAPLASSGQYYTDKATKITYQNLLILAREGSMYVVRASLPVAEEIAHLEASAITFSMALRPDVDTRLVDARSMGETTSRIITKYGLPVPEKYPFGGPYSTLPPLPGATPLPTPSPTPTPPPPASGAPGSAGPSGSPAPSASPS